MSKELESFNRISKAMDYADDMVTPYYEVGDFEIVENGLKRLEAIDNANPSEALKLFENMQERIASNISTIEYTTIKQALLKAQEPKQYLKWEDLEFKEDNQRIKVKLGSNIYTLDFYTGLFGKTFGLNSQHYCEAKENKQFFNDLHLERVEEWAD